MPNDSVKIKCLENLNVYGNRPIKLIIIINRNNETMKVENPLMWAPVVRFV